MEVALEPEIVEDKTGIAIAKIGHGGVGQCSGATIKVTLRAVTPLAPPRPKSVILRRKKRDMLHQKIIHTTLFLFTGLCGLATVSAQQGAWTEDRLQQLYLDYLEEKSLSPSVDQDGDVQFQSKGLTYFIDVDAEDTAYFAVMLANAWEIESEQERQEALLAGNKVTATAKVIKSQIIDDYVWFSAEVFLPSPEDFQAVFPRMLSAIQSAQEIFVEAMMGREGKY